MLKIEQAEEKLFLISTVACINKKLLPPRFLKMCEGYLISQLDPLSDDDIYIFLKKNQVQDKIRFQSLTFDPPLLELADKIRNNQRIPVGNTLNCIYKFKCGAASNVKKFLASISDNEFLHTLVQRD